jgi:hypothetical protein
MVLLDGSTLADLDRVLLPAGKIFRSCAQNPDSALHPASSAVREFVTALKGTKERLSSVQTHPAVQQIQISSTTQRPVGLDFGKPGDLALPSASHTWARLE